MAILFKNNAASTLDYMYQAPNKDFVDIYVNDPTVFPTIASDSDDYFYLTFVGEDTLEIVKVFAQITNANTGKLAFRSYRAQEGTTAQEWTTGARIEMRITAEALNSFVPTAVQLAKDNVDAIGVASTTNVGFAGVDGQTTKANSDGVVTAKDVAIAGDLRDLASARGQIGNSKAQGSHDFSSGMLSEKPGMYTAIKSGSISAPFTGPFAEMILGTPTHRGSLLITSGRSTSPRAAISAADMNEGGGFSGYNRLITEQQVGDGITINNGIISVPEYEGATASTAGTAGLVPSAAAGEQESFLTGGGEYKPALSTKGGVLTGSVQINDTANVISIAPAENTERGIFLADKNGAVMGGFDNIQRADDNVKWTQMYAKSSGGNITTLAAVAHEDGTGEVVTYHPIQISGVQLNQTVDNGNRVFILSGDNSKPGYSFRFSPDTGEAYMDGRAIHAKADSAIHADTAGTSTIAESAAYWKAQNSGGNYTFHDEVLGENPPYIMGYALNSLFKIYSTGSLSVNYANSAGSAPANGGTSWATTVTPNAVCSGGRTVPEGGSWAVIYKNGGDVYSQIYAGGATLDFSASILFAIRVS